MHGVGVMDDPRGDDGRIAPTRGGKWHWDADRFHHTNADCIHAESTERGARHRGTGGKPICTLCDRLDRIDLELDGPWFPLTF